MLRMNPLYTCWLFSEPLLSCKIASVALKLSGLHAYFAGFVQTSRASCKLRGLHANFAGFMQTSRGASCKFR